jgi:sirohydrochlorin ferrochelatase
MMTAFLAVTPAALDAQGGLLVVAHGASKGWNDRVRETVQNVNWDGPVALAFLMGAETDSSGWEAGVARLVSEGAREITVVPLMVSSHGSHYRQIRFYAGELPSLPPEMAHHDHGTHWPPPVPMRVTPALDDAPEFAAALSARWREMAEADRSRPLLLVAHGPNDSDDAVEWLEDIGSVSEGLRTATGKDLYVGLLRDDAPAAVRAQAVAAMRDSVLAMAQRSGDSVVALPVMISSGSITRTKIPTDLAGLPVRYHAEPLAPLPELSRWIERVGRAAVATERAEAR